MQLIEIGVRAALGAVFAIAAGSKLRSRAAFDEFIDTLPEIGPLRGERLTVVGAAVVALELAAPVLLVVHPRAGLALVLGLVGAFTTAMVVSLRRGAPLTCRCFGASAQPIGAGHVVRNALLLAATALATAAAWLGERGAPSADLAEVAIAAALGAIAGVLITRWDDLVFVYREAGA